MVCRKVSDSDLVLVRVIPRVMSKLSVDIDVSGDVFSNGGGNTGEGAVLKEGTMKKKAIGKRFAVAI